jgi:DNA modification methylase
MLPKIVVNYNQTFHKIIIGDCRNMRELSDSSVQLVVTSPPYFNAPFDYQGFFKDYDEFLDLIRASAKEIYRVMEEGRIACINCDDMLVDGEKYPIVADITRIYIETGFRYRDKIIWRKPEGYIRISKRSGVLLQHPYPMYFYPDNLQESILIFQKGKFDYKSIRDRESSVINLSEFQQKKWNLSVWDMVNVLPHDRIAKGIAAFPGELPRRLIILFSYVGETVLDPFLGSGTTTKVAMELGRKSVGYEMNPRSLDTIKKRLGFEKGNPIAYDHTEFIIREDSKEQNNITASVYKPSRRPRPRLRISRLFG